MVVGKYKLEIDNHDKGDRSRRALISCTILADAFKLGKDKIVKKSREKLVKITEMTQAFPLSAFQH